MDYRKITSDFKLMIAGGITGTVTWCVSYAHDSLNTIIQTDKSKKALTLRQAYKIKVEETGYKVKGLFKGLGPTLLRGFVVNAVLFYVNEYCHKLLEIREIC